MVLHGIKQTTKEVPNLTLNDIPNLIEVGDYKDSVEFKESRTEIELLQEADDKRFREQLKQLDEILEQVEEEEVQQLLILGWPSLRDETDSDAEATIAFLLSIYQNNPYVQQFITRD